MSVQIALIEKLYHTSIIAASKEMLISKQKLSFFPFFLGYFLFIVQSLL